MKVWRLEGYLVTIIGILLCAVLSGAAQKEPPSTCRQCNRKITDAGKLYAVMVLEGIEATAFDDIGCAMLWYRDQCAMRQSAFDSYATVPDHLKGDAVPAEKAFYAISPAIMSPAGYGIAAFRSKEDAQKFAAGYEKSRVMAFGELMSLTLK